MEEDHTRIFVASSELFSDFQVKISLYNVSTLDDIINQFKNELLNVLENLFLHVFLRNFNTLKKKGQIVNVFYVIIKKK